MFILGFIMLALLFGYLQGGSTSALSHIKLRHGVLVAAALSIQVALFTWEPTSGSVPEKVGVVVNAVSYLLVITFVLANSHIAGARVLATGVSLNALAIIANGGYAPSAISFTGTGTVPFGLPSVVGSALWCLGDVLSMPQAIPLVDTFSVGDVLIGLGIFIALREMMQPARADIQLLRPRYQPKHLAGSGRRATMTQRAG